MHKTLRRLIYAVVVASLVTILGSAGVSVGAFDGFQRRAADALFPSAKTDKRVVIVAFDKETIDYLNGSVTPTRDVQAEIGLNLASAGAAVVAWDVVFTGEKPEDLPLIQALSEIPKPVIAATYSSRRDKAGSDRVLDVTLDRGPQPYFADAGNTVVGHANVINDPADGVVRGVSLVYDDGRSFIPSLSLAAVRAYFGQTGPITIAPDGVQVGDRFIPTERRHVLRLNFASDLDDAHGRTVVSARDVITRTGDPNRFKNKIVLVGATEALSGDTVLAPVDKTNTYPGVLIHANAINTMLTSSYLVPVSDTEAVLTVGLIALLVALGVLFLPVWVSVVATFLL